MQVRWVKQSLVALQRSKWKGAAAKTEQPGGGAGSGGSAAAAGAAAGSGAGAAAGRGGNHNGGGGGSRGPSQPPSRQGSLGEREARLALRLSERDGVLHQV